MSGFNQITIDLLEPPLPVFRTVQFCPGKTLPLANTVELEFFKRRLNLFPVIVTSGIFQKKKENIRYQKVNKTGDGNVHMNHAG